MFFRIIFFAVAAIFLQSSMGFGISGELNEAKVFYGVHKVEAPYVSSPVKIDGDLAKWKEFYGTGVNVKNNLEGGKISDDKDLGAAFYFAWDDIFLYFAARVDDNQIVRLEEKEGIWKDDCIELFIDPKNDGLIWGCTEDFQIGFAPAGDSKKEECWAWFQKMHPGENVQFSSVKTKSGYNIEAAIKWEFLNIKPQEGISLGVSPAFHDKDNDDSLDGKLNWCFSQGIFGKMGRLTLVNKQSGKVKGNIFSAESGKDIDPQEYYEAVIEKHPGFYPRWLTKKQSYWTMAGVPDDTKEVLLCEDGSIEPFKRGFSILPFLYLNNKLITRDDAKVSQSLEKDYLPIPSVKWNYKDLVMDIKLFVDGKSGESSAYLWYKITNNGKKDASGKLYLAFQPFQIFPPWQGGGGFSPIKSVKYESNAVQINKEHKVYLLTKPERFGAEDGIFKTEKQVDGDIMPDIMNGTMPAEKEITEPNGIATGAAEYSFSLKPGESRSFFALIPLYDAMPELNGNMEEKKIEEEFRNKLEKNIALWESKVGKIEMDIPETEIFNTLKSNILYSLVTRDGSGFQPGSRSYDKVWMRDGGMSAAALLRMGLTSEIKDFADWYSQFQFETGEVPPIIDAQADDPLWEEKKNGLIEYDSQGEFIYTIFQYYLFTKDRQFLEGKVEKIVKALQFLAHLRSKTMTAEFKEAPPEKRRYYGILPPSTSHEGYASEYSYWDDFWALKGWKDARAIFSILGKEEMVSWADKEYADFKKCLYDSIKLAMDYKKADYIPGSASLVDFDPTSTAVAIMYCDELENLPKIPLQKTFDQYYRELKSRFSPRAEYRFTPYELRSTPAFLYMGEKEKALDLLRFMLKCRRPLAWNHWAEVVHSDERFPTYIGDMPHTWVGTEYINVVRCLFVYEMGERLILGAGIDEKWLERKEGLSVKNMPTYFGNINYWAGKEGDSLKIKVWGEAQPDKGFVFKPPFLKKEIKSVFIDGMAWKDFSKEGIVFSKLPADIVVQ